MKKISVVSPCYNEELNIPKAAAQVREVFRTLPEYDYEHIFIDNGSEDGSREVLRGIAAADRKVKVIFNNRNFGPLRSPVHGILAATGDAVIMVAADLEEPIALIPDFIRKWREGYRFVSGIRNGKAESWAVRFIRRSFYTIMGGASDVEHIANFTGFGLYDREVIELLRGFEDMNPYFRGMIAELGFKRAEIPYFQAARIHGRTSTNFFRLYEVAIAGIVTHTKAPLRIAALSGFILSGVSLLVALGYLLYKLLYWNDFQMGMAPVVIGVFFLGSVQLLCLGVMGEYIGAIFCQVRKRPLVVESERLNF